MHAIFFCFQPNDHNKCENINKRIAWFVCVCVFFCKCRQLLAYLCKHTWSDCMNACNRKSLPITLLLVHASNFYILTAFYRFHFLFHENYNCLLWTFGFHRKIVQNRLFWWYVTRVIFWNIFRPQIISWYLSQIDQPNGFQWKLFNFTTMKTPLYNSVTIEKLRISLNGPSNKFSRLKVGVCHGVPLYYVSFDFTLDIFGVSFLKLKTVTWNGINSNFSK